MSSSSVGEGAVPPLAEEEHKAFSKYFGELFWTFYINISLIDALLLFVL